MFGVVTNPEFLYENRNEYGESIINSIYNYGWTSGIAYKNYSQKSVGLALELNYIKKGGYNEFIFDTDSLTADSTNILFKHELEYIEFPFMMNIRFGKKKLKINLYGGPNISYLIKEKINFLEETYGKSYKSGADMKFEFGLNGGGGISYQIGKNVIEIGMRYSHSLTNIFKYESINSAVYNQNQVISARFHYYYIF